jgi:hypothetical protein
VKNFLPQIAKANEELEEQIKKEGQDVVRIDKDLVDRNEVCLPPLVCPDPQL